MDWAKILRIHLMTAIVLMFVVGCLIWANTNVSPVKVQLYSPNSVWSVERSEEFGNKYTGRGWPGIFQVYTEDPEYPFSGRILWYFMVVDIFLWLGIVAVTVLICEYAINKFYTRPITAVEAAPSQDNVKTMQEPDERKK